MVSKHTLGHFGAPPSMKPGYGTRFQSVSSIDTEISDTWTLSPAAIAWLPGVFPLRPVHVTLHRRTLHFADCGALNTLASHSGLFPMFCC